MDQICLLSCLLNVDIIKFKKNPEIFTKNYFPYNILISCSYHVR